VILSLDPGSSKIGWAVINNNGLVLDYGLLSPVEDVPKSLGFNLKMNLLIRRLIPEFESIIRKHKVTHVAWEIVPSFGSMANREHVQATATTLKVIALKKKLPYQQFTPQSWHKKALDKAKCTKDEVKSWVLDNNTLSLDVKMTYDVYDAIAIGLVAYRHGEWITNELL